MQPNSLSIRTRAALISALSAAAFGVSAQTTSPGTAPAAPDRAAADIAFVRADVNKDGKVTKDEVTKLPAMSAKFAELDKDKDGALTKEEFAAGYGAKS